MCSHTLGDASFGRPRILLADHGGQDSFRTLHTLHHQRDEANNNEDEASQHLPPAPNPVPVSHPLMNPTVNESARVQSRFMPSLNRLRRVAASRSDRAAADRSLHGLHMIQNPHNTFIQRSVISLPHRHSPSFTELSTNDMIFLQVVWLRSGS